jgi:hypothetical protein
MIGRLFSSLSTHSLSGFQDKLTKIVLIKRPMRFGGLVKRKAPRDMDIEGPDPRRPGRFDEAIEFLDRLRVEHTVVRPGTNSKRRLGPGFDTVGIGDQRSTLNRIEGLAIGL